MYSLRQSNTFSGNNNDYLNDIYCRVYNISDYNKKWLLLLVAFKILIKLINY